MKKIFLIPLAFLSLGVDTEYLQSWATYRLTEMFDHLHDSNKLETHFSHTAWQNFQTALDKSNIAKHRKDDDYETRISKFITPVKITRGSNHTFFAQSVFLVSFSNAYSSWQQPMELILTIDEHDSAIKITDFEGKASNPLQVKNYALDRAKDCKSKQHPQT